LISALKRFIPAEKSVMQQEPCQFPSFPKGNVFFRCGLKLVDKHGC